MPKASKPIDDDNSRQEKEIRTLTFQLDCLRDKILDLEEEARVINRTSRERNQALQLQKRDNEALKFEVKCLKEALEVRDDKLREKGVVFNKYGEFEDSNEVPNGSISSEDVERLQKEISELIENVNKKQGGLGLELEKVKFDLQYERARTVENSMNDVSKDSKVYQSQIKDLKFKITKLDQEKTCLENSNQRLDNLYKRSQEHVKELEDIESKLKTEVKSKNREIKSAKMQIVDLESDVASVKRKLEKQKSKQSNR